MTLLFLNEFPRILFTDVIDILLVAVLLYQFFRLFRGTGAIYIFIGIIALYAIYRIVKHFQLEMLGEILSVFSSVGFIALIVVFQPEIRKFLFMLGKPNIMNKKHRRFFFWRIRFGKEHHLDIDPIVMACERMSKSKTGALLVFAVHTDLQEYVETGEFIDAAISSELIENIFFKNSPLHDGAMLIRENRIVAVRCILPVSDNQDLPVEMGLRHRAAIGVTEHSDALAVIVSEQTGKIAICRNGVIHTALQSAELKSLLKEEFFR